MYLKLVNFLRGSVAIAVESPYPERVVNLCAAHGIPFWGIRWQSEHRFTVHTTESALPHLRQVVAAVPCTVTCLRRSGAPRLVERLRKRYVLLAALALGALLLLCGNVFIWDFEVTGNTTVSEERILRVLEDYGITVGSVGLRIDQDTMRNHVLLELPELSWLVVNVKGCVGHVQVVERLRPPERVREDELTNMVALRAGLVTEIRTLDGKAEVARGSTVREGQLLISGIVDSSRSGVRLLHGMGTVWARTWYDLSVLVPLREEQRGAEVGKNHRIWLDTGKRQIKLYTKGSILPPDCGKILHYGAVCLPGGFRLPITLVRETVTRYESVTVERSESAARAEGEAELLRLLENARCEEGEVVDTRFASARQGDYLLVTLRAECHEQIARQVVLPR